MLFKVKVARWRGAVYIDNDPTADVRDRLVAAGIREDGSNTDFYADLLNVERDPQ